jgi:tetratricopeptide (TPR) repeat protein
VTAYNRAITLDPMDAGTYSALGDALLARGRNSEAIRNYTRSLTLYPHSTVALFKYADACLAERLYDEAILALHRVLSLSPRESPRAYQGLARVYLAEGRQDLAAEAERKASFGAVELLH